MALTNSQHILHELQAADPLTEKQIQSTLKRQQIIIPLTQIYSELSDLIEAGWVEYYGDKDDPDEIAYELCNRWYCLPESEREKILVN
jgi:DNA-binding PadR family transcriptional regulator